MERYQVRLDIFGTAAAGTCFGTRRTAVSTHQDFIPEPHNRTSKRISKHRQRRTFYIEDLIFTQELPTNIPEQLSYKHQCMQGRLEDLEDFTRTSSSSSHKDMYKIMLTPLTACHKDLYKTMHCKDLFEDFGRISARSSYKDLCKITRDTT
jgi:hypothetical protein